MNENVKKLHSLAMLSDSGEEAERELTHILSFLGLPADGQGEFWCRTQINALREDAVCECMEDKNILLSLAPNTVGGFVALPKALEGDKE